MFWDNFKEICEKQHTTPGAVCRALKLSNATATHWKHGKTPSAENVRKLAEFLKVSADALIGTEKLSFQSADVAAPPANEDMLRMQEYCEILSRTKSGISRLAFLVDEAKRMTEEVAEYERKIAEIDALDESRKTENA